MLPDDEAEAEKQPAAEEEVLPPVALELPKGTDADAYQCDAAPLNVPGDLAASLRPFQLEGVRFLHKRWCLGPGVVLADDSECALAA
jgi:SNF2 family DNA or RNA helicase